MFDAAIECLKKENEWMFFKDSCPIPLESGWADAAIRVLEAAAKVDREKALGHAACHPCDEDYGVYGLIFALPDAPKGGTDEDVR